MTPHLTIFFILNFPVALIRLRTTLLQETSTAGLALITCYFIDNLLLVLISLSYKAAPPALTQTAITKEGARYPCPEQYASWIERAFFTWGDPMIRLGFRRPLTHADVWDFCPLDYTSVVAHGFHTSIAASRKKHTFLVQLIINFRRGLASQLGWAILWCCLSFVGPLELERILHYIKNKDTIPVEWGYFYVASTFVGMLMSSVASSQMLWRGCRTGMQVRGLVLGEMYSKLLRRKEKAGQALKGQSSSSGGGNAADGSEETSGDGGSESKEEEPFSNGAVNNMTSIIRLHLSFVK